jgi:hypothetical protein
LYRLKLHSLTPAAFPFLANYILIFFYTFVGKSHMQVQAQSCMFRLEKGKRGIAGSQRVFESRYSLRCVLDDARAEQMTFCKNPSII